MLSSRACFSATKNKNKNKKNNAIQELLLNSIIVLRWCFRISHRLLWLEFKVSSYTLI